MTDNKKKVLGICIFCALLFLLLYVRTIKNNEKTYINADNEYDFSLEQKQNEKEEESVKWDKASYQKYEKWLLNNDSSRNSCSIFTEGEQWRNNPEVYCELWGESFFGNLGADGLVGITADMFSEGEPIAGGLLAEKLDGDLLGMRIVTHDEMGYVEYSYYDSGALCYLSRRGLKERGEDLPEYAVCTDVFAHYKIPEAYEEAETDWNEWVEKCHGAVKGELEEYCIVGERIYVIDREKQALADITNTSRWYVNQWIVQEAERVSCSMKVTQEAYGKISGWLPKKYFVSKEIGVCDLNQDGKDDYVAVVYQEKFDAYRKEELIRDHDEIWLFLSNAEGEYDKKILLADMPFYCPELRFSGKGRLVCENFIGFESYINDPCRTEYFLYDQEKEDFYLFKALQAKDGNIIIDDKETIGECNIKDYYLEKYHETEGWKLSKDSPVESWNDRTTMFHDYHMEYRNKEEEVEREVNQKIAQCINIYMEDLNKNRSGGISYGSANIKYADSRVFCGEIDGPCGGISVIIDAKSGLPIDITKMITKKEMLEICRKGMKSMDRNKMSPDEMEVYIQYVQAGYETASSLTPCSDIKKSEEKIQIKFLITAWGIECVCMRIKDDTEEYSGFMIDKEYFIDTPLWKYMEPDSSYIDRKGNRLYCSRKLVVSEDSYQICQTDYTRMNYRDGYYYYQSSADHFYLYKSDGKRNECLAKQVPKEIYPNNDWIYFTNASDGQTLYKICTDGTGMKQVLDQKIDRFILLEDEVYYISGVDGYLYSWQEETGSKLLYQGNCRWINTDGKLLYIREQKSLDNKDYDIVAMDKYGNVLLRFDIDGYNMIPTDQVLYYLKDNCIVCAMPGNGKETENIEIPVKTVTEETLNFGIWEDSIYVMSYKPEEAYTIYRYEISSCTWDTLCVQKLENSSWDYRGFHDFHIKNSKIFIKEWISEGKGELWQQIDTKSGRKEMFEDMEYPCNVKVADGYVLTGVAACSEAYFAEDYTYNKDEEDGEGNLIKTNIVLPQLNEKIKAYQKINEKIKQDAEDFYKEHIEFAEYIKDAAIEWENESCGEWSYLYAYADSSYVSIVYWKFIGRNGLNDIKDDHYEVKLYSSETREELSVEDLFDVSRDEVLLRFSYAMQKSEAGLRMLWDDLDFSDSFDSDYNRIIYCFLAEDGVVIRLVERMRTKVTDFIVGYDELADISKAAKEIKE